MTNPPSLTFYTNPLSRGRIVRWMLEEIEQPYKTVSLEYGTSMKAAKYLAINPMGKVPALRHGERVLTECGAIICYLAEMFPSTGLLPVDRASYLRWMFFGAGPVDQAMVHTAFGWELSDAQEQGRTGYGSLERVTDTLTEHLKNAPYMVGESFSAADVFIGGQIGWGLHTKTLPANETLAAYWARLIARPALIRATQKDDALAKKEGKEPLAS